MISINHQLRLDIRMFAYVLAGFVFIVFNAVAVPPVNISVGVKGGDASTGGSLFINRIELVFDNNRGDITVPINGKVKAKALINYTGNGVLNAVWLVDGIAIQQISRNLSYGADIVINVGEITPLPSFEPGEHKLSLQIFSPSVNFSVPTIKYFVSNSEDLQGRADINIYLPGNKSFVYKDELVFSWNDPARTGFYKITVWQDKKTVVSAISKTYIYRPSKYFLHSLISGKEYSWQVVALNDGGVEAASSAIQSFKIRPDMGNVIFSDLQISTVQPQQSVRGDIPADKSYSGSRNIKIKKGLNENEDITVTAIIENWRRHTVTNIQVDFKIDGDVFSRQIISEMLPGEFVSLQAVWHEPVSDERARYENTDTDTDETLNSMENAQGVEILATNFSSHQLSSLISFNGVILDTAEAELSTILPTELIGVANVMRVTGLDFTGSRSCADGARTEYCFGAVGMQCGVVQGLVEGQFKAAVCQPNGICMINGGSWRHDECCYKNPNGYMCDQFVSGDPALCKVEWDIAVGRTLSNMSWYRMLDFNKPNCTGQVVFEDYCAPTGSLLHPDDTAYCCTKKSRAFNPLTDMNLLTAATLSTHVLPPAPVNICIASSDSESADGLPQIIEGLDFTGRTKLPEIEGRR